MAHPMRRSEERVRPPFRCAPAIYWAYNKTFWLKQNLAVLRAKIKIKNPRIRAGIGPKPTISLGKWQSGPSPGTPRGRGGAKNKIKNNFKHFQAIDWLQTL